MSVDLLLIPSKHELLIKWVVPVMFKELPDAQIAEIIVPKVNNSWATLS